MKIQRAKMYLDEKYFKEYEKHLSCKNTFISTKEIRLKTNVTNKINIELVINPIDKCKLTYTFYINYNKKTVKIVTETIKKSSKICYIYNIKYKDVLYLIEIYPKEKDSESRFQGYKYKLSYLVKNMIFDDRYNKNFVLSNNFNEKELFKTSIVLLFSYTTNGDKNMDNFLKNKLAYYGYEEEHIIQLNEVYNDDLSIFSKTELESITVGLLLDKLYNSKEKNLPLYDRTLFYNKIFEHYVKLTDLEEDIFD